jgi:hypothetical protein
MKEKVSNADKGKNAVAELVDRLEANDTALLYACANIICTLDKKFSTKSGARIKNIYQVKGSYKSDILVSFEGTDVTLAIAVISAETGGGNQIEKKTVDSYKKDQGLPDELLRILKLFTGTTKPENAHINDFSPNADLAKGYAHFSDLSAKNQMKLIQYLRTYRKSIIECSLLGRGGDITAQGKKIGTDFVNLFAFRDNAKRDETAWSYVAATEVLQSIMTTDVQPAKNGARQIALGHGITLKRYGGGNYPGDLRYKDLLQLQIQPRKVLAESTDWSKFKTVTESVSFELEDAKPSIQSAAAHRGLYAELVLIEKINARDEECTWIVEECCGTDGYGNFKAKKPCNKEKPDVLLYQEPDDIFVTQGISMKTYKPEVSFNHANRGPLETFVEELGISKNVAETLRAFVVKDETGDRKMLNEARESEQEELLHFFRKYQRQIISHVLCGKPKNAMKANWLLLHEAKSPDWISNVGNRDFWHLYPMAKVIDCCCSETPSITKAGNLILGLGLTLQRKGGDGGAKSANDLQFKLNPKLIHEALRTNLS